MLDLIWDLWQQEKIRQLERGQLDAGGRVTDVQERIRALDGTVEKLMRSVAAMWAITKERTGATDEELIARVRKMEEEEGVGASGAVACTQCGRMISGRQKRCMYCGAAREGAGVIG